MLFLVTEIMFFTALIGTYLILRNSLPSHEVIKWPKPEDVHLVEWIGAFNTFVLILSSLTVVLAHYAAAKGNFRQATIYVGVSPGVDGLHAGRGVDGDHDPPPDGLRHALGGDRLEQRRDQSQGRQGPERQQG
mgnify:CR=1 FL=1